MPRAPIRPVILCGGSGTRLWPLSRSAHPKQFARFFGADSLLQATLRRLDALCDGRPVLMTANDYRFLVGEQLAATGIAGDVVVEPAARDTGPALAAAAEIIAAGDPDALMLVAPSDHVIRDRDALGRALAAATAAAKDGHLVTFGVAPDRPETGYGYIELATAPAGDGAAQPFLRFVEKPDVQEAKAMLAAGRFLWNSGMFLFPLAAVRAAFAEHAPGIQAAARAAVRAGTRDLDFFRLGAGYAEAEAISIDYAVMEKTRGMVVPLAGGWNDLGSWQTVWQESARDESGVAASGPVTALGCASALLRAEPDDVRLVAIGLRNIAAVAMRDAVLVADMDRAQEVRDAVAALTSEGAAAATEFPRCYRPWGWYETLARGPRFQVKRIMVKPGGALSQQRHRHRAEHWVVVAGTARVTVGEATRLLGANESVDVPLGAVHRLENPGQDDMHVIEVQTGDYLGEDDIERYDDLYARG